MTSARTIALALFASLLFVTFTVSNVAAQQSSTSERLSERHEEATEAVNQDTSLVRLQLDLSAHRTLIGFVTKGDVVPEACEAIGGCQSETFEIMTLRTLLGLGFGGLNFELGFELAVTDDQGIGYAVGLLGLRADTSTEAPFFASFRFAGLARFGELSGAGGRAGFGLNVRPAPYFTFYFEGTTEIVSASGVDEEGLNESIVSYGYQLGGGFRGVLPL